ncbi:glycosyltransferase family 4 protein [Polynucleobacter sp. MWH-HuK1]|uniref:glycosyltransferase family 4 protein n=1 Tax=Polynucleobacter sp. MWH-HuK1 TaxID=1743158 RepID=UPI001C0D22C2|nr:glycosyltransferase family 4 protein [Polynucleobacter sp. MWH-HuK1]
MSPKKIVVLPHGVDTNLFHPLAVDLRQELRATESIDKKTFVLLTVTNEVERKGCFLVLDAIKEMITKDRSIQYRIVGRDDYAVIKRYAASIGVEHAVQFLPAKSGPDLIKLFQSADAFILPTFYEAFGLVGIEAMACGLPLVATQVGGIEDYLQDGKTGLFILRTKVDIEKKVNYLIENPEQRQKMAISARQQAENYSWTSVLGQLKPLVDNGSLSKDSAGAE